MSQWDKLLQRITRLDKNLRFEQLKKVLESYGYIDQSPASGSSHHIFRNENKQSITIPKTSTIKTVYVKMVKEIVEKEGSKHEQ